MSDAQTEGRDGTRLRTTCLGEHCPVYLMVAVNTVCSLCILYQ